MEAGRVVIPTNDQGRGEQLGGSESHSLDPRTMFVEVVNLNRCSKWHRVAHRCIALSGGRRVPQTRSEDKRVDGMDRWASDYTSAFGRY